MCVTQQIVTTSLGIRSPTCDVHWVQGLRQCILSIVTAYLVCGITCWVLWLFCDEYWASGISGVVCCVLHTRC